MSNELEGFKEAVANITLSSSPYFQDYVFYMHLLGKCKVVVNKDLPAAAGVSFHHTYYQLHINPTEVIQEFTDKQGNTQRVLGFNMAMPLAHRIGIIKHEMLHIALGHLTTRFQGKDIHQQKANIGMDCALDQSIDRDHLPSYAIYPDNFPPVDEEVLPKQTAEYYYDLLDKQYPTKEIQVKGDGEGGSNPLGGLPTLDDHATWGKSEGDPELQKELTKKLVEDAADKTIKNKGTLPSEYQQMIENLTVNREVDWKQVLRRIVGNKKTNKKKTILRKNRRLPDYSWIKGHIPNRTFRLAVVSDVSGSVSDNELKTLWGSILDICGTFQTEVTLVQVDTTASEPETLKAGTKIVERKACGGTILYPAIQKLYDTNTSFDAVVITTDNYLFGDDVDSFKNIRKPVIWLVSPTGGSPIAGQTTGSHKYIKLKNYEN